MLYLLLIALLLAPSLHAQETIDAVNLGPSINSATHEIGPVISPDGKTLYFSRKFSPSNSGGDDDPGDIWYSTLQENGSWATARNIGGVLNNRGPNYVNSITPDGNTLLLSGVYSYGTTNFDGVSISRRTDTGWSYPEALRIRNLRSRGVSASYFLASDGRTLLVNVDRPGGTGGLDLYVSRLQPDGSWSEPLNLGPAINTTRTEYGPFLGVDGVTLYFSSNGHEGYGRRDLFLSRRLDSSWTRWSVPENLGPAINTPGDETDYTIDASGEVAYFATVIGRNNGSDIYRIALPKKAKPQAVVLISGRVLQSKTGTPVHADIIYEILGEGVEVGRASTSPQSGEYMIALPAGRQYSFRAASEGYFAINENLDLTGITEYTTMTRDLRLAPVVVGATVRLNNIFFDFGADSLRGESYPELDRVVTLMRENPKMVIEIAGHTDALGTESRNVALSESRARAVAGYIVSQGIALERVTARGYGKSRPLVSNDTEEGRQKNRRVEFTIIRR
jgi:outer membrane protein OmpA-like peptidoglycan-associated protein